MNIILYSKKIKFAVLLLLCLFQVVSAQLKPDPCLPGELINRKWPSGWAKMPGTNGEEYGVYLYRNRLDIPEQPEKFIIHISADNRYKLFVNNRIIGLGPATGDPDHWIFDTYDIAGYLVKGENIIAVMVWNYGIYKPASFVCGDTRFLCQGNGVQESVLNTPGTWKVLRDESMKPLAIDMEKLRTYLLVPPGDHFTGSLHPWEWQDPGYDDSGWMSPELISFGSPRGTDGDIDHALVPRLIPAMMLNEINEPEIRRIDEKHPDNPGRAINDMVIPPGTRRKILLDQKELVNSFPVISWSKGHGATITITYGEALFDEHGRKGHRDSISGKTMVGFGDLIIPDGGDNRRYTPLWFRTYRYAEIEVETKGDTLVLHAFKNIETGYPFEASAFFKSGNPDLDAIWETGWRTAKLCAGETYFDCPYYEQMQYIGDTRIQALISLYVSGDARLMRKAITDFYHSVLPEGLTQSRYPSNLKQIIPTYSLLWISMIHDYLWHRPDYAFVFEFLIPIQNIISWFEKRLDDDTGMLGPVEFWPFIDWVPEWEQTMGAPADALSGNSSIVTLLFAMATRHASEIFDFYGYSEIGQSYAKLTGELIAATYTLCWDDEKQFMADSPSRSVYSQHANALAVLTGAVPEDLRALVIERAARSGDLIQAGFYFKYYLHQAMIKSGLGNKYIDQLYPWKKMIDAGLTTFAERPDPSRSDCHAWSASPLIGLISGVAGIRPGDFGFESVIIEPKPGNLDWIKASCPHYLGDIEIDLKFSRNREAGGTISLPPGLSGIFIWEGSVTDLDPGKQKVQAKPLFLHH